MQKLTSLRRHLLESETLNVAEEFLNCFAEKGVVETSIDGTDESFSLAYDAHVIFTDFNGDFLVLSLLINRWMANNQPDHGANKILFHVDILDHEKSDISIQLPLSEHIKVSTVEGGTRLETTPEANVHKFTFPDMQV